MTGPRAVGAWSGLGGVAGALGPLVGGTLVEVSWRLVFLVNLPLAALVVAVARRHVPESTDPEMDQHTDVWGAALGALGLGGSTYALVRLGSGPDPATIGVGLVGVAALALLVLVERRSRSPMLPLDLFSSRQFTAANLVTFAMYAALGGVFFLLVLQLQLVAGFSPLGSGLALLPVTAAMLLLSARAGALAQRIGPRLPMTAGPVLCACGLLLLLRIRSDAAYPSDVLPAVLVFGLGLSVTVAPLTATVLAAVPDRHAGVASGVNNAVARAAGLLAVAALPALSGISGEGYRSAATFGHGFRVAMLICAGLLVLSAALAGLLIRNGGAGWVRGTEARSRCAVDGPPLRTRA